MIADELVDSLLELASRIAPYAAPVWAEAAEWQKSGKRILFEGAQGVMLDVDYGTYPFVTSSNTVAGQALVGIGTGVRPAPFTLGIAKAYATRVGAGPFPTELGDEVGARLGERGREFGTVTGRKRRCGWLDATLLRQAVRISGIDGIALSKIDVLDGLEQVRISTAYRLGGDELSVLPPTAEAQETVEPVYEELSGWDVETAGIRKWEELPLAAQAFVNRVEELAECPVALISTSPERDDMIVRTNPFG